MTKTTFSEAKAHLSRFARLAEEGKMTVVLKHNSPSFIIAPVPPGMRPKQKRLGILEGRIQISEDFDRTPEELIEDFYGNKHDSKG